MADAIKIKKILEAGKVVYPATILDAVKDAKSIKVEGVETNPWYNKTLRQILADQASGASAEVKALEDKLYVGTPAEGVEGEEGYKPAVKGDIVAIQDRLDTIEGDSKTEGSIKKAAADAVAEVVAGAPESFDTLKEIAEWISKDAENEEAFDAANRIVALETAVSDEQTRAEGAESDLQDAIDALDAKLYGSDSEAEEGLEAVHTKGDIDKIQDRLTAIEESTADADALAALEEKLYGKGEGEEHVDGDLDTINAAIAAEEAARKAQIGELGKQALPEDAEEGAEAADHTVKSYVDSLIAAGLSAEDASDTAEYDDVF